MSKILLVDDDRVLCETLVDFFSLHNFLIESVELGNDALQLLTNFSFDVIVLDWDLPDTTGIDVLRKYRASGGKIPIIMLTGRGDITNKEAGFESGADDYLVKPFDVRELLVRVKGLQRRSLEVAGLSLNGVVLHSEKSVLVSGASEIRLTGRECALLDHLLRHPDRTFSAKALLDAVWPSDNAVSEDTVRACMKRVRQKLSTIDRADLIETVLGSGYTIKAG